jgi:glutathione synthase/RimK-type ligase-like ATP-grasp enzyme
VLLHKGLPQQVEKLEAAIGYPIVLKIPDGAFSVGVEKAADRAELQEILTRLFQKSSLLLAQEFLYTDYDWRIGVLNNQPIFACRYYMVRNHWQIYQHSGKKSSAGNSDTLPVSEAPRAIVEAALKATRLIGNGLYGVDVKEKDGKGYVIEVNDNPSIDSAVEDLYLGDELYKIIMSEMLSRMEARRNRG